MKTVLLALILSVYGLTADSAVLKMYGKDIYGFDQPKYEEDYSEGDRRYIFNISALADSDNFPFSSYEQGSIFSKIFLDLKDATNAKITIRYKKDGYDEKVKEFERGALIIGEDINARFGVYYETYPFSKNSYLYPAFFENKVHLIMRAGEKLDLQGKNSLKNYKGIYSKTDRLPSHILKDFSSFGIEAVENLPSAFEQLLTGKADYIASSYYPAVIECYKQGIRKYVSFSKAPVWKAPMFFRVLPQTMDDERIENIKKYLKSSRYKKVREEAFKELIKIYEENTKGKVPPTYIGTSTAQSDEEDMDEE